MVGRFTFSVGCVSDMPFAGVGGVAVLFPCDPDGLHENSNTNNPIQMNRIV
jgi:hypothetical protein